MDGKTTYSQTATPLNAYGPYPATSATTITYPDNSKETISFVYVLDGTTADGANYHYETAHSWYDTSGALLRSTMRCYNQSTGDCTTTAVSLPITQIAETTTLGSVSSKTVQVKTAVGLVTEFDEYDYGASTPTRKTLTSYASLGSIVDRPSSVLVESGSNVPGTRRNLWV